MTKMDNTTNLEHKDKEERENRVRTFLDIVSEADLLLLKKVVQKITELKDKGNLLGFLI